MNAKAKLLPGEKAQVLILSTRHLGEALVMGPQPSWVSEGSAIIDEVAVMQGDYGWLLSVGPLTADSGLPVREDEPAAMQVLRDLLHFAKQHGCRYVMFDAEGMVLSGFPTYDW